jgi:ABC-type amino acid transport substrate-binding protein/mono/diheme cytochrome c family protein
MRRIFLRALLAATALAGVGHTAWADQAAPLRLCADPANLPFSTASEVAAKAGAPGLYVEIGEAVAGALGRKMTTVWSLSYFGKRNLGATLLAGQCDFAVGLPLVDDFMGPRVIFSQPIMSIGYAIATRGTASVATLADLDGKRVAVQFASPPQSLLATHDAIQAVTVMDPDEGMQLLAAGRVDAAFVWGPSAGYANHALLHDSFAVWPVDGPQMRYRSAIGFARSSKALRDQVDAVLPALTPVISALIAKYAVPDYQGSARALSEHAPFDGASVTLVAQTQTADAAAPVASPTPAPADAPPAVEAKAEEAPKPADAPADAAAVDPVAEGREIFNGTCGHCHGPDAIQSERRINLRLLRHRYGDQTQEVFHTTVTKGRPAKGMPTWEGIFTEDDFTKIYAFLSTLQEQ